MGFTASARSASICWVTFIVPISAVIAAPTRPATIKPVRAGPSSRNIASATTGPTAVSMFRAANWKYACGVKTAPVNAPVTTTTSCEPNPTSAICLSVSHTRTLPRKIEEIVSPASTASSPSDAMSVENSAVKIDSMGNDSRSRW